MARTGYLTADTYPRAMEDGDMTTKIRWERGVAGQVAAHLLSDDGGHALVHCMVPGGTPRFLPRVDAQWDTSIVDAPACDTFKAFQRFVTERFGDDDAEAGRASILSATVLLGGALSGAIVLGGMVRDVVAAGFGGVA